MRIESSYATLLQYICSLTLFQGVLLDISKYLYVMLYVTVIITFQYSNYSKSFLPPLCVVVVSGVSGVGLSVIEKL